jgi:hypothetical protein
MRPFKMFFGLAIGIILFLFVARVLFFAFIAAAIMSILYAIYRRVRDFISYDRYGEPYFQEYDRPYAMKQNWTEEAEPLFYGDYSNPHQKSRKIQFVEAI